ncbi:MAG: glycosyltransferase family 39 protein, partial [Planctomycetes bacterium]|nr:glycosyltransferase family 39 protein [Planctomycetota bacterium]
MFHLPAGVSHLELGRFDLYRVNPPLVRIVAALPVMLAGSHTDWGAYDADPHERAEYVVGIDFFYANDSRTLWLVSLARCACIPFCMLGGWVCFRWASRLYGGAAGLVALTLWCFCPYVLGHGALITPDAHATAMGIAAAYTFWLWLKEPDWQRTMLAGVVLGAAELTKFTLLVFYPLWLLLWILWLCTQPGARQWQRGLDQTVKIAVILGLSVLVINVGYGFEGTCQQLRGFRFQSCTLTGSGDVEDVPEGGGNRFDGTWLGSLPVPLPKNFVQGVDAQKANLEHSQWSHLRGKWQRRGWWYFYLYALAIKIPLGTWLLVLLAVFISLSRSGYVLSWRDEFALLAPVLAVLLLVSSQTNLSVHSRYVLPILPFAYIWTSKVAGSQVMRKWALLGGSMCLLGWAVTSSVIAYPHSLSYFNELVAGPRFGHAHLTKSDTSWGQDLRYLKRWLDAHPETSPLHLASCGPLDPRLLDLQFTLPPVGPRSGHAAPHDSLRALGPLPGWYAIDVNFLQGG